MAAPKKVVTKAPHSEALCNGKWIICFQDALSNRGTRSNCHRDA